MGPELMVVNYHYIRDSLPQRGIHHITPAAFTQQLDSIRRDGFRFISLSELHRAIRSGDASPLGGKCCLITFDDGLRESYEIGVSLLDKMGIPAVLYVSSATLGCEKVLDVHKFHHVQSKLTNDELMQLLATDLKRLSVIAPDTITAQYPWDDAETAKVKYLVNFVLDDAQRAEVVDRLFSVSASSEREFAKSLYLTQEQVRDLGARGWLGSHGKTHSPLAGLSGDDLQTEMVESRDALAKAAGHPVEAISYPYGGQSAVSRSVFVAAADAGFISGMTMMRGLNDESDIIGNPLQLKRFDTNDVFGGKSAAAFAELMR
jgi:peptidoglycan/xylan/chitin deacetylase (PgdA/CDA1 family)